ncbi:MAG: ABC transporter permease [Clostridiales bacterium]|nr:ABC transporter permease [Clostridiales bacterium]
MSHFDPANIPQEKFSFAQIDERLFDKKFETKPIGYFRDAWLRFKRNKGSVVAAIIILLIVLYGLLVPFFSLYQVSDSDGKYAKMRPKSSLLMQIGIADGNYQKTLNDRFYIYLQAIGMGIMDTEGAGGISWEDGSKAEQNPIVSLGETFKRQGRDYRIASVDSYYEVGFQYLNITRQELDNILAWQEESGLQVVYPMVDTASKWCDTGNAHDANFWYRHAANSSPVNEKGKRMDFDDVVASGLVDNYLRDQDGNILYYAQKDRNMIQVRVLYYNYFIYRNGYEPLHPMGTDAQGYDIMVRLAHGIRVSLLLAVSVSMINLTIGAIYGAIEGYYGGWVDLVMERVTDILSGIPFMVVATLFQLHLVIPGKVSPLVGLLYAFVLTGWISTAYRVRTQFYRFKGQEYVLAARTLGARDRRIMFRHIFPNALGTIITSSVLVIPGVILTESILSYLGIVNFNSQTTTSLGTMLGNGQGYLSTDPHIIFFPALVISLLMLSFNLFGNGLRDAFNPSLRGAEE